VMQTPASPIEPWANPAARPVAKCLDRRVIDGMVRYVQDFGRRRPAAYLLGCAAAGFAAATVVISATSTAWSVTSRILRGVDRDRFGPN
jgi:hypothetical protein